MNNAAPETRQQRRYKARQDRKGTPKLQKNAFKRALEAFTLRAEALQGAMAMGPIAAKLALMELAHRMGQYKSRGHGRGTPMRRYGLAGSWPKAHASGQECLRRAVGGWGWRSRYSGLTKNQTLQLLAPHGQLPLERGIQIVRGLRKVEPAMALRRAA